ncbi:MAG: methionine--tRNA ligase [Deltaproteobacteria bacterium]|nr:methionine--tRNA ligase [Deltaproteobacteria bacterium]
MSRPILVTAALPYANGAIHLGHMVEHIQTDIYVRYLRSSGRDAVFLCADDTHGTPIEVAARKAGVTPEAFIGQWQEQHQRDFRDFGIDHAYYGSTNYPENKQYADLIFKRLTDAKHIEKRQVEQYYCEVDKRFLPDRFIKGTCPNCKTPDQYGDVCESCGKTYAPTDLINPKCALCGTPPVRKSSAHYFVKLSDFTDFLKKWTDAGTLDPAVRNSLQPWFEKGLEDWDVSRDGPYFGFKIPGEDDKYYYVWLDAPIGYISTTERWNRDIRKKGDALAFWAPDAEADIIHVIGKDIVYFHTLFWPAMLNASKFKLPKKVIVHGMLTLNGAKMSKTRGTFINARQYLDVLDPSYLRWFFAANLGPAPEDIDLSLEEFRNRVNAELVNNLGNLANRALSMIARDFGGVLADDREPVPLAEGDKVAELAVHAFENLELRGAVKSIAEIGAWANKHLADREPWKKLKGSADDKAGAHRDLSFAVEVCYRLAALIEPIVPAVAQKLFDQIGAPRLTIAQMRDAKGALLPKGHKIGTPAPLIPRLDAKQVDALIQPVEAEAKKLEPAKAEKKKTESEGPPAEITIDDFVKIDLRVGKVLACKRVEKSDKLLEFSVDLGEPQPRTIVSGIAKYHTPEELIGKSVAVVANLAPRLFKAVNLTSHGMILSAATGSGAVEKLKVVLVDPSMPPGSQVR